MALKTRFKFFKTLPVLVAECWLVWLLTLILSLSDFFFLLHSVLTELISNRIALGKMGLT